MNQWQVVGSRAGLSSAVTHREAKKHQLQPGERERDTHTHIERGGVKAGEGGSGGNRRKRERDRDWRNAGKFDLCFIHQ